MKTLIFVWTVICLILASLAIGATFRDTVYTGRSITFATTESRTLKIQYDSASLEAASDSFFLLKNASGTQIAGVLSEKPLGWKSEFYFKTEPTNVSAGEWIVEEGSGITIRITSDSDNLTVTEIAPDTHKVSISVLIFFVAALVWFVILAIINLVLGT